jgi:MoaA/NifB/PqqE/SkfB family radical SAM enzyme
MIERQAEKTMTDSPSALRYRELKAPLRTQVELTEKCNNRCVHCYNHYRASPDSRSLSPDITQEVIEELGREDVFAVTFTGGEPLLEFESLLAGIRTCTEWGINSGLNSNLSILGRDEFQELRRIGLNGVLTSLMSCNEELNDRMCQREGVFEKVVEGIKEAKLAGLRVSVNMVVSKDNLHEVYKTGEFCYQELGIDSFSATRVGPSSHNLIWFEDHRLSRKGIRKMLDQLKSLKKKYGMRVDSLEPLPYCTLEDLEEYKLFTRRRCVAGITTCTIGSHGEVRPCSHADLIYGNVFFRIVLRNLARTFRLAQREFDS